MSTVEKILGVIKARGLTIKLKDGQPVISGDPAMVTPEMHKALAEFRAQILDHLKLSATKPSPAKEPDWARTVFVMDAFGQTGVVVNKGECDWKHGQVAWQYYGENGWRQIVGKEELFPVGIQHA